MDNSLQPRDSIINFSHQIQPPISQEDEASDRAVEQQGPKNRSWTSQEHLLYLIFLEINKARVKSKSVRHSNIFFKEMAGFVKSKTEIQCRSHNHKYQEKYKYPYRIIKEERLKLENEGFSFTEALQSFKQHRQHHQEKNIEARQSRQHLSGGVLMATDSNGAQTQLGGLNIVFMTQEGVEQMQINNYYCQVLGSLGERYYGRGWEGPGEEYSFAQRR